MVGERRLEQGVKQPSEVTEMFFILMGEAVITWIYIFVRTHQSVCLKWVHFIVCVL